MDFNNYINSKGRPLPVFLLVDVSGSMRGQKIDTVNVALKEMIKQFRSIENPKGEIELCLITFGNRDAKVIRPLSPITDGDNYLLCAEGNTPMGMAFDKLSDLVEDDSVVSGRAYTPTIVLISDGNPTDYDAKGKTTDQIKEWGKMSKILQGKRTSRSVRLAMGIGADMNIDLLKAFVNNPDIPIINAMNNGTITKFFKWVTLSVSTRSVSNNPNAVAVSDPDDVFDNGEVVF